MWQMSAGKALRWEVTRGLSPLCNAGWAIDAALSQIASDVPVVDIPDLAGASTELATPLEWCAEEAEEAKD